MEDKNGMFPQLGAPPYNVNHRAIGISIVKPSNWQSQLTNYICIMLHEPQF